MRKADLYVFGVLVSLAFFLVFSVPPAFAIVFGSVRGVVHDPQHRPIPGAAVTLKAQHADWGQTATTDDRGEFLFAAVPLGDYSVTVVIEGFETSQQTFTVVSDTSPVLHFQLQVAGVTQSVTVSAGAVAAVETVTPTTMVNREDIQLTPGADRTNSLAAITDYVPGAYFTHDQLHIRGGHQVSWLIDGVPVPNTNIASNVGPQFDPKDVDYLEALRGSYDAGYGDRTYGVFNVVPRTGFERDNDAELVASAGSFYQTNDELSLGGHTLNFAYYGSVNGNASQLGLETPVAQILHDDENGLSGFASLIFNPGPANQLRVVASVRHDNYQIPNTPDQQAAGLADVERESDSFVNVTWARTFTGGLLLTVSPMYHYNTANYDGGPADFPISTTDQRTSQYAGAQTTLGGDVRNNSLEAGFFGFHQHDDQLFGLVFNDGSNPNFADRETPSGHLEAIFFQDKFRATPWLTLDGGVRQTYFSGAISEAATSPRVGASIQLPALGWVVHGFWGRFYQAPPLVTASGPLLAFVTSQSLGFVPLQGERDEERQVGVTIPVRGWTIDADVFRTAATNFFDHNNVGNSNVFFPLTIDNALIRGEELTIRSPRSWRWGQVHLAYSNQLALGAGAVNGGLTDFSPPTGYFDLDHDQRNTLNAGVNLSLPRRVVMGCNVYYGSGFTDNGGPAHLPGHTTTDLSLGKALGANLSVSVTALNVADSHLLIDNSLTFGGTHFNSPREIYASVRYRFHY